MMQRDGIIRSPRLNRQRVNALKLGSRSSQARSPGGQHCALRRVRVGGPPPERKRGRRKRKEKSDKKAVMSKLDDEAAQPLRGEEAEEAARPPPLRSPNGSAATASEARRALIQRSGSAAQGSLANMLPMLEEPDASSALLDNDASRGEAASVASPRSRAFSDMSFDLDGDLEEIAGYSALSGTRDKARSPGDIRTAVLEWMYEEKDQETCADLCLANANVLEDLISVFVNVVLHGKSDVIRAQVWRFLIQGSINSHHFAFLVICNLNASCHSKPKIDEDELSAEYKRKRAENLAAVERIIDTITRESLTATTKIQNVVKANEASKTESKDDRAQNALSDLESSLHKALGQLEDVHDSQVLSNLDMNVRGRTSRQNVDMLVLKVRNAMVRTHTAQGEEALRDLDGKIGFIKALTDLDDWLRVSVAREDRANVLETKLAALAHSVPFGA
ncbi:Hypothetical Protein FCC1311_019011 [Hondaea fermentalgiana]|uniref:Uncharacterized protein n=1 Tax=Hondaea fermentalgiana TaxID=2315210 RepID=A0A2R5GE36_9STRA|nr:Hypothetical Protein FCC1311_019011 [Hondaea fermentalgiana]|eukprot:GBG28589.1 Hypothetical Protein FCC1311_019011 [Hondaea fermentalgiana]